MITSIKGKVKMEGSKEGIQVDALCILTALYERKLLKEIMQAFNILIERDDEVLHIKPDYVKAWEQEEDEEDDDEFY